MLKFTLLMTCWIILEINAEMSSVIVDLSNWNKNINFTLAKEDGVVAIVHKATEGNSFTDRFYASRRIEAEESGLLWGAYHYARNGSPIEQADYFLNTIGDPAKVLVMLDLEPSPTEMTPDQAEEFVIRIKEKTGRYPLMYGSVNYLGDFNRPNLNKCSLWIAHWTAKSDPSLPPHRKNWVLWQYTDGKVGGTPRNVSGIGACDRDRYNGSVKKLKSLWPNL